MRSIHNGRNEIIAFFSRKWVNELDYRLIKELWALFRLGP
jgi:nuclear transport factor 2 (NTF2) superfamily protein